MRGLIWTGLACVFLSSCGVGATVGGVVGTTVGGAVDIITRADHAAVPFLEIEDE